MEWKNKPMKWKNEGTPPSPDLVDMGFVGGYKPPASVFNHFFFTHQKLLDEVQENVDLLQRETQTETSDIRNTIQENVDELKAIIGSNTEAFEAALEEQFTNVTADIESKYNELNTGKADKTQTEAGINDINGNINTINTNMDTKVDKEAGKGLSTNDFTNADKAKTDLIKTDLASDVFLAGDGTYKEIDVSVETLANKLDKTIGGTVMGETNFTGGLKKNGAEIPALDSTGKIPYSNIPTGTTGTTVSIGSHIHDITAMGGVLPIAKGGTGANDAAKAREGLGFPSFRTFYIYTATPGKTHDQLVKDYWSNIPDRCCFFIYINYNGNNQYALGYRTSSIYGSFCLHGYGYRNPQWYRLINGTWSYSEYLPLSGGTVTGYTKFNESISVGLGYGGPEIFITEREIMVSANRQELYLRGHVINCMKAEYLDEYATIAASFSNASSRRFKENIKDISLDEANKIYEINPVKFDYIKGEKNAAGVIAEEVEPLFPNVCSYSKDNPDDEEEQLFGVDYSRFVPYLIKIVQEQKKEIDEMRAEVKSLKMMNSSGESSTSNG